MLNAQGPMLNAKGSMLNAGGSMLKGLTASLSVYVVATIVLGRDLLTHISTSVANDAGDPLLNAAILHWDAHVLPLSHAWWQFPIFFPTADALTFSEHLLGVSVIAAPIAWITGDALVTYNVVALLTFPLCAVAVYALTHRLTKSAAGAFVAGLAFAFSPYRIAHLPHIQMLAAFWAPMALVGLHAYIESGRRRWLVLYGATWMLQGAANGYVLFYFSVLVGLWMLWFVVAHRRWRALAEISVATVLAALPLVPVLYTFVVVHSRYGFVRSFEEVQSYSADISAFLCAPPTIVLWGWLQTACRPEGELFPGTAVLLLAVVGLALFVGWIGDGSVPSTRWPITILRRAALLVTAFATAAVVAGLIVGRWRIEWGFIEASSSSIARPLFLSVGAFIVALVTSPGIRGALQRSSTLGFYLIAAVATWSLALGPTLFFMGKPIGDAGPFRLVMLIPGVDSLRVPARFWLMTTLCLAVVAGFVVAALMTRRRRGVAAFLLASISIGVLADGWSDRIVAAPMPPPAPDAEALRGQVVLALPAGDVRDVGPEYEAVVGGWKSVNGYSGYGPSYYQAIQYGVRSERDELFEPFRAEQDLYVLVPSDAPRLRALVERQPGAVMTAQSARRIQYRLPRQPIETPALGARVPIQRVEASCSSAVVSNVIDGDPTSRWYCGSQRGDEVLTMDLGHAVDVSAIVNGLGPYASEFPRELVIETSVDGSSWADAWRGIVISRLILGAFKEPRWPVMVLPFQSRTARYVRLRQVAQDPQFYWSVAELEVRGAR